VTSGFRSPRWAWYDLTGSYNNETSSFYTRDHSSEDSDYSGGGGAAYPGTNDGLTPCVAEQIPYFQPSWDERISSLDRH
jgi:hypothetical protein